MNDSISTSVETFWNVSAELALQLAFRSYLQVEGSPEGAATNADAFATRRATRIDAQQGSPAPR